MIAEVKIEGNHLRVHLEEEIRKQRGTTSSRAAGEVLYDETNQAALANRLGDIRRRVQLLGRSSTVIGLHNSIWRLLQIERRILRAARRAKMTRNQAGKLHRSQHPSEAGALTRLAEYQKLAGALKGLEEATAAAEDAALLVLYGSQAAGPQSEAASGASQLETDLRNLLGQLLDLRYSHPNRITLAIYSENKRSLFELARGYFNAALSAKMNIQLAYYTANIPPEVREEEALAVVSAKQKRSAEKSSSTDDTDEEKDKKKKIIEMFGREVTRMEAPTPAAFLSSAPDATTAIILSIEGKSAYATYESEHGLHTFIEGKAVHNIFVASERDKLPGIQGALITRAPWLN